MSKMKKVFKLKKLILSFLSLFVLGLLVKVSFLWASYSGALDLNDIKFSTTHILGYNLDEEILINRVSGTIIISRTGSRLSEGKCELLDEKKF